MTEPLFDHEKLDVYQLSIEYVAASYENVVYRLSIEYVAAS
jgi:hypothetical protein